MFAGLWAQHAMVSITDYKHTDSVCLHMRLPHLSITGWLLFWQSLILILLEGSSEDINTYLRKARTTCVDVDSNGRKVSRLSGHCRAGCIQGDICNCRHTTEQDRALTEPIKSISLEPDVDMGGDIPSLSC